MYFVKDADFKICIIVVWLKHAISLTNKEKDSDFLLGYNHGCNIWLFGQPHKEFITVGL